MQTSIFSSCSFCSPSTSIILKLYCLAITSTELCGLVGKKASLFLSIMFGISKSQREKRGAGFCKATSNSLLFLETFKKLRFSSIRNSFNQTDQQNATIITWRRVPTYLFLTFTLYANLKEVLKRMIAILWIVL